MAGMRKLLRSPCQASSDDSAPTPSEGPAGQLAPEGGVGRSVLPARRDASCRPEARATMRDPVESLVVASPLSTVALRTEGGDRCFVEVAPEVRFPDNGPAIRHANVGVRPPRSRRRTVAGLVPRISAAWGMGSAADRSQNSLIDVDLLTTCCGQGGLTSMNRHHSLLTVTVLLLAAVAVAAIPGLPVIGRISDGAPARPSGGGLGVASGVDHTCQRRASGT